MPNRTAEILQHASLKISEAVVAGLQKFYRLIADKALKLDTYVKYPAQDDWNAC